MLVDAFNFAESNGVGTPGIKQPDGENEASKSLDRATFGIGETEDQKIATCKESGEAGGSVHMTRKSWADISSDDDTDGKIAAEMAAARLTSQVCAVRGQSVK